MYRVFYYIVFMPFVALSLQELSLSDSNDRGHSTRQATRQKTKTLHDATSDFQQPFRMGHKAMSPKHLHCNNSSLENKHSTEDPMIVYLARQHRLYGKPPLICDMCEVYVTELQLLIEKNKTQEEIVKLSIKFCVLFKIQDERICSMVVPEFKDEILYVVANLALDPKEVCGILLGDACATPYFPGEMWNVTFPNTPKPPPKPPTPPKPKAPTLRVLHFSDIHIDYQYLPKTVADCGEPVCCRANDNATSARNRFSNDSETAGTYGTYTYCDAPVSLATTMFRHLKTIEDQFDYVIFTGDIPARDVWNQTKTDQIEHINTLGNLFGEFLPNKPVYYCMGNHESAPVNSFPPPGIPNYSTDWLYGTVASVWKKWLPESAVETILRCGGYSVSPYPGFRIISVNNNYCNNGNYWLLLNATDPCNVLQWLIQELQNAEDKSEKVHLLMHIPPGSGTCMKAWSYNFYKIVNRYENTIVNQFNGHSHHDSFHMFYDDVTFQRPLGVGFVAGSVTPSSSGDPVFRIYTIDGNYPNSSWAVLDYQSFYLNLTEANLHNDTTWQLGYSAKSAYNMSTLYAADWEDLIQRMSRDDTLFQLFYKFNQNMEPSDQCHGQCKEDMLCDLKTGRSHDPDLCNRHK